MRPLAEFAEKKISRGNGKLGKKLSTVSKRSLDSRVIYSKPNDQLIAIPAKENYFIAAGGIGGKLIEAKHNPTYSHRMVTIFQADC